MFSHRFPSALGNSRVIDKEPPVAAKERVKGETQQPALATGEHSRAEVEEDGNVAAGLERFDSTDLFDYEEPAASVTGAR